MTTKAPTATPREYEITAYVTSQRTYRIKAKDRQQAMELAYRRAARAGLEVISVRVPFLDGDEE